MWSSWTPCTWAQTVQLPSFQRFSVNTSVLAPDRGWAHLGGVSRSARGSSRYGVPGAGKVPGLGRLLGNRAIGSASSAGGASVHVTVIDHDALDRAVLAEAKRRRTGRTARRPDVNELSRSLGDNIAAQAAGSNRLMSVAEIRQQNARHGALKQQEALRFFAQGKQAEAKKSYGAAKIYYQMAHRRANLELQKQVARRLEQLHAQRSKSPQVARH